MTEKSDVIGLEDLAAEIRDLIFDDADQNTQGAMIGCPIECLVFAKKWIQERKKKRIVDPCHGCQRLGEYRKCHHPRAESIMRPGRLKQHGAIDCNLRREDQYDLNESNGKMWYTPS